MKKYVKLNALHEKLNAKMNLKGASRSIIMKQR